MRKLGLGIGLVSVLACASVALAASSPTVKPTPVTGITTTSAVLHGTVNPNGDATSYHFGWGPTTALGTNTTPGSLATGTTAVAVTTTLKGLIPGTTYYYALSATNAAGTSSTQVESFKTSGNPPPVATTGTVTNVESYAATFTGTVAPSNQATTFYFQYGTTASYGLQTGTQTVAAGTTTVPVSFTVPGLAPGTVFHYRLVANHGSFVSFGADTSFETLPNPRPVPRLRATTRPRHRTNAPFTFRTTGHIVNTSQVTPDSLACTNYATIRFLYGNRVVAKNTATIQANCTFSASTTIARLPGKAASGQHRKVKLTVEVRYAGNSYLTRSPLRHQDVMLG
jgi:phosphodiesterase/alkaline phosphatase D-like protein